jgi:metal-responsive CopG/Arc/MetJ family transcriptional regulator
MRNSTMSQLTRVNVLFSEDEVERFNTYCSRHGFKKSTLIARLVREHLDREDRKQSRKQPPEAARKEPAAKIRSAHSP